MAEALKKHKKDIIIIAAILLVSVIALTLTLALRRGGDSVRVTIDGAVVGEYPLAINATYEFKRTNENGVEVVTNTLVIEDGVAYLSYADCPDKTCVKTGKIKYIGQSIVCLPNKLAVSVIGEGDGGVDLVS